MSNNSKACPVRKLLTFADVHCILKIAKKETTVKARLDKVDEVLKTRYNIPNN